MRALVLCVLCWFPPALPALTPSAARAVPPANGTTVVNLPNGGGALRCELVSPKDSAGAYVRARGIQFAEHPIGSLRWQPPVRTSNKWKGEKDATKFAPDCAQGPFLDRFSSIGLVNTSEECLFLNVWAPFPVQPEGGTKLLPVMYWIYGGSFTNGGSIQYPADGVFAVKRDVIIVTANYRLGLFGFLGGDVVQAATSDGSAGNFGLQDTRAGVQWVRDNIAAFGGDKNRITIYGESAGSSLVALHLLAPRSKHLYFSAVMESGAFDNYTVQTNASDTFWNFTRQTPCKNESSTTVLACLRGLSVAQLNPAIKNTSDSSLPGPCVDGVEVVGLPDQVAKAGLINPVQGGVMLGSNQHEAYLLMPFQMPVRNAPLSSKEDVKQWVEANYKRMPTQKVMKEYEEELGKLGGWHTAASIFTDSQYTCPTFRSAQWLHRSKQIANSRIFVYQMEYTASFAQVTQEVLYWYWWCNWTWCKNVSVPGVGAGHGAEIPLVWNNPTLQNSTDFNVAQQVMHFWHSFASSGDPNVQVGGPEQQQWNTRNTRDTKSRFGVWKAFSPALASAAAAVLQDISGGTAVGSGEQSEHSMEQSGSVLHFTKDGTTNHAQLLSDHHCDFWASEHN